MTTSGRVRSARRLSAAVAGVLLTASCAAGQHAETAKMTPAIDAARSTVGSIQLAGISLHAPDGSAYPTGSNVQVAVTLVNNGNSADTLVNVTSDAFTGWGIVDNAEAASVTDTSGADTGLTIDAGSAQRLGLADNGASATASPRTLVLMGLAKGSAPLYPGTSVNLTFRFANAGSTTVRVPVQVTGEPSGASVAAPSGSAVE